MIDYYKINGENIKSFPLEGKGEKNLLLIIADKRTDYLIGKLKEIMKAIKYDLENDCYFVFNAHNTIANGTILNHIQTKDVIVFENDHHSKIFNLENKFYVPLVLENKRIVMVENLTDILEEKSKKLKFWQLLQKMFFK